MLPKNYEPKEIGAKWRKTWEENQTASRCLLIMTFILILMDNEP